MAHLPLTKQCKKNVLNKVITSQNKNEDMNNKERISMKKTVTTIAIAATFIVAMTGCNKTQEGAGVGAAVGALAGLAIGGDTAGTLVGAGAGALVGGAIGNDQED